MPNQNAVIDDDSGMILFKSGSAAAPSIAFERAPTVGHFLRDDGSIGQSVGGAEILAFRVLQQFGIPLINISSGSIAANGAISGITALPVAYPHAYCYFPANALATSIAAGWYYCTFSTTSAGTAFLNTFDPTAGGVPSVPASPTAVTDGRGAYTGVTSSITCAQRAVGSGLLGLLGRLDAYVSTMCTNNANAKSTLIALGATTLLTLSSASLTGQRGRAYAQNAGAAAKQMVGTETMAIASFSYAVPVLATVDTAAATNLAVTSQKATATDNLILADYTLTFTPSPN